jgi:LuxR family quorum sensing-dependent transcriptional regulator
MADFSGHLSPITVAAEQRETEEMTREADIRQALEKVSHLYGFHGFLVMVVAGENLLQPFGYSRHDELAHGFP